MKKSKCEESALHACTECGMFSRYPGELCAKCDDAMHPATPRESTEGVDLWRWLEASGWVALHVPNGLASKGSAKNNAKAQGLVNGAADYLILDRCIAVELKQQEGGRQSEAQKAFQHRIEAAGWVYVLAEGAQDAIDKLMALSAKRPRLTTYC
jgi:hypothetical protein